MVLPPMLSPRIHLNLILIWYKVGDKHHSFPYDLYVLSLP